MVYVQDNTSPCRFKRHGIFMIATIVLFWTFKSSYVATIVTHVPMLLPLAILACMLEV